MNLFYGLFLVLSCCAACFHVKSSWRICSAETLTCRGRKGTAVTFLRAAHTHQWSRGIINVISPASELNHLLCLFLSPSYLRFLTPLPAFTVPSASVNLCAWVSPSFHQQEARCSKWYSNPSNFTTPWSAGAKRWLCRCISAVNHNSWRIMRFKGCR